MSFARKTTILAVGISLSGIVVFLSPLGLFLEETVGLKFFFSIRGSRKPPDNVMVVSIDKESAARLEVPSSPNKWPRSLYAQLVRSLMQQGAAIIVFDLTFEDSRSRQDDQMFADAISEAGNVILFERLVHVGDEEPSGMHLEKLAPPNPVLAHSAAGLAPFPLPKIPVRLNQYWAFKEGAGEKATLPVVGVQLYAREVKDKLVSLLASADPPLTGNLPGREGDISSMGLTDFVRMSREFLTQNRDLPHQLLAKIKALREENQIDAREAKLLRCLVMMYGGPNGRYLNYYGPPASIPTISFHRFITGAADVALQPDVRGKAVFIGLSQVVDADQKDNFYTVFSRRDGTDLCGVEIIATAFANLLENDAILPLGGWPTVVLLVGWASLLCVLACTLPLPYGVLAVLLASGIYLLVGWQKFSNDYVWYPLFVPLFLQAPLSLGCSFIWKFRETGKEKDTIRRALDYYVPPQFAHKLGNNLANVVHTDTIAGICLFTDAGDFTTFSEKLSSDELAGYMRGYFEKMFTVIENNGGIPLDIRGDSIMAIWEYDSDEAIIWNQACQAALEINRATKDIARTSGLATLPTRVGLHFGTMSLGNIGARGRYQYTIMGDTVNTASRLESLNKQLGTNVLLSRDLAPLGSRFLTRGLGRFLFKGKTEPVGVYELISPREEASPVQLVICELFTRGLALFRSQMWLPAAEVFSEVERIAGGDGPAAFYNQLCATYQQTPPAHPWDEVVQMKNK